MNCDSKEYFDELAERWDDIRECKPDKIRQLLALAALGPGETVLDAGCGTGILVPFIKERIGIRGRIKAVDFSHCMIAKAAAKYRGVVGVDFIVADICCLTETAVFDSILCFNFFPHIKDKNAFIKLAHDMLKASGKLIIMHDISRQAVNSVHKANHPVKEDRLPPAVEVAVWLENKDFAVQECIDCSEHYFIKAIKL